MLTLLLSMIGTSVWAKPGKPRPEPETFDYQIWIGNGLLESPKDVVLQPYDELDHLVVENVDYSGRWLPPPTKARKNIEGWSIGFEKSEGDYCGTYEINNQDLIDELPDNEIYTLNDKEVYRLHIFHSLTSPGTPEDILHPLSRADWWNIMIQFDLGEVFVPWPEIDPSFMVPHFLVLQGNTDTGLEPEGEYDADTDTWTVYFNEASFRVSENTDESIELWAGQLSFTVKIKRTIVQS
jgi:hypothetical protein